MDACEKERIWALRETVPANPDVVRRLAGETGLLPVTVRLLMARGYDTADKIRAFIRCEDVPLHDPFLMRDMKTAVDRLTRAVQTGEKIVIYGDYDVDGVTSVSLLYLFLKSRRAAVSYYIPRRDKEGYGLSPDVIESLAGQGVTCVVTVDTGSTANEEVELAARFGMDMIVTDHHECRLPLPAAVAVVNPHRPDCGYPFKDLAGVGVVLKLVTAYAMAEAEAGGKDPVAAAAAVGLAYIDLVAVGTVADVMPLCGENRLIVKTGLSHIAAPDYVRVRPGIAALMEAARRPAGDARPDKKRKITAGYIGFILAPRLNAAGRMEDAGCAVELLLSDDPEKARLTAEQLCVFNTRRQTEENRIVEAAIARIDAEPEDKHDRVIVLAEDGWHPGVIGIVASRLSERYNRPAVLISLDGDRGRGSGRSVPGFNLVGALNACEDLLDRFGGHELAAGLTVRRDRVDAFRRRINAYAADYLPAGGLPPTKTADLTLSLSDATVAAVEDLQQLEPFGVANPSPRFVFPGLALRRVIELSGGKHLKLVVSDGRTESPALCFGTTRDRFPFEEEDRVDLLVDLDINDYWNRPEVQLKVADIRPSDPERSYHPFREDSTDDPRCGGKE